MFHSNVLGTLEVGKKLEEKKKRTLNFNGNTRFLSGLLH